MLKYLLVVIAMLIAVGCSSIESDAKKAALLINKSIEQTHELEFEKAEKSYLKAQDIIKKYVEKDKVAEFYQCYTEYRDKEKEQSAK